MAYTCNTAEWPIIEFSFSADISDSEGAVHLSNLERMIERNEPYLVVCDLTGLSMPEPRFVRTQMEWMRAHLSEIAAMNRGTALVLPSALTRGMLLAMRHFVELPVEIEVFETMDAAQEWARTRLRTTSFAS